MPESYHVAIVGGGPAGATVALCLARRGWKVCLFEATRFDAPRYGETLPPEINPALRELGLFEAFLATAPLESPGIVSAWGSAEPAAQDFLRNPYGPGWHVDRNCFDQMLWAQAVAAGAEWIGPGRVQLSGRDAGLWRIGGIGARFLVDASGRNGLRIDGDCDRDIDDRMLTIVLRGNHPKGGNRDLRTFIETASAGWWYSAPLPHGDTIAMFFTDCDVYASEGVVLEQQLQESTLTRERLQEADILTSRIIYTTSSCRKKISGEAWLAAGDSASTYDPLSGRGIFKAIRQGERAAQALDACLCGEMERFTEYATYVRQEFESYVVQRRAYYATERRWPEAAFWAKRSSQLNK